MQVRGRRRVRARAITARHYPHRTPRADAQRPAPLPRLPPAQLAEREASLDALSYTTLRRFSDFAWLRAQLREIFPYLIVPALPDKQQLGRFGAEFVDMRQRALQRWIERVAAHPELSASGARRAARCARARRGAELWLMKPPSPPPPPFFFSLQTFSSASSACRRRQWRCYATAAAATRRRS